MSICVACSLSFLVSVSISYCYSGGCRLILHRTRWFNQIAKTGLPLWMLGFGADLLWADMNRLLAFLFHQVYVSNTHKNNINNNINSATYVWSDSIPCRECWMNNFCSFNSCKMRLLQTSSLRWSTFIFTSPRNYSTISEDCCMLSIFFFFFLVMIMNSRC